MFVNRALSKQCAEGTWANFMELNSFSRIEGVEDQLVMLEKLHLNGNEPPVDGHANDTHRLSFQEIFVDCYLILQHVGKNVVGLEKAILLASRK